MRILQVYDALRSVNGESLAMSMNADPYMHRVANYLAGGANAGPPPSFNRLAKELQALSAKDLLLLVIMIEISEASALNPVILASKYVLKTWLEERGYSGFGRGGSIPATPPVLESFRRAHPELRDVVIKLVPTVQELRTALTKVIVQKDQVSDDVAFLFGTSHKQALFLHRGMNGNAFFVFDTIGK